MIIKRLFVENLRSYENQEIIFPRGSTLLSGDIGSGKTTILLAIEFALFGLQPSQKGNSLLRTDKDQAKVILEFEIDNQEVIIERTLKRSKKSVVQDYSSIKINNEKFEESITEIKARVLKLLNYPQEFSKKTNLLYKFTVYTPQEEMKQIILEPGDIRLNTLRHVFGINKYKQIEENLLILALKLREKIRFYHAITYDIEDEKQILEQKKQGLKNIKQEKENISNDYQQASEFRILKEKELEKIKEKIEEKKHLEAEKSKSELLINEKTQQMIGLKNNINNIKYQLEETKNLPFNQEEYDALDKRIEFQENKQEEVQKEYIQIMSQINSQELRKKEIEILQNKITNLEKCPTCLQEVSENYKKNISQKTAQEIQEIYNLVSGFLNQKKELSQQIEIIKNSKENFKKRKSELEIQKIRLETISEKQQRILDLEKQKKTIEQDSEIIKKHLETMQKSIQEYEIYESIFNQKNSELQQAKLKEDNLTIKKAENNKEIQLLEQQIKEAKEKIQKKQDIKKKSEKLMQLESWISNKFLDLILFTEKQVMLNLKQEFSNLFSKWFSVLVSDTLNATLDQDFSPIITQQDYELDYSFLSGGERTAIALAYRLSLNQVINSLLSNIKTNNLVILDEPTDGFSEQQLDKMRDVLNQLKTEQLIIVSHEPKIEGFVDNIIRIRKENNLTRVE